MASQVPPRHRPSPLVATHQPTTNGAGPGDRSHLLSSLRSARPTQLPTPQMMPAFASPQDYQSAMLGLQQQILLQQSQILLASQQQEAQQAFAAMRRQSGGQQAYDHQANLASVYQKQQQQAQTYYQQQQQQQQQAQTYQHLPQSAFLSGSFTPTPQNPSFVSPEEEASVMRNPLAASALARRKRQSLNMEAAPLVAANGNGNANGHARRISLNGVPSFVHPGHHRRASSSASSFSASNFSSSNLSNRSSPTSTEPPALILSKPGEAFPTSTSGSEAGSDRSRGSPPLGTLVNGRAASPEKLRNGRTCEPSAADMSTQWRPTHSHSSSQSSASNASVSAPEKEASVLRAPVPTRTNSNDSTSSAGEPPARIPERRASQASTLTAALSGRRQRPASIGAPPPLPMLEPQQRSVSDSSNLSPFATTFQPLPPSPYTPSPLDLNMIYGFPQAPNNQFTPQYQPQYQYQTEPQQPAYQRPVNPVSAGTASAIRQPRGPAPESDFKQANFAAMVRRSAIATILRKGSAAGVGVGTERLARLSLVEV